MTNGFAQTFPVVIDRAALPVLDSSLRSNDRNCFRAFRAAASTLSPALFYIQPIELLVQPGQISHPLGYRAGDWFLNVNSPRELALAPNLLPGSKAPLK